jgi:hypothetical protein
MVTIGAKLVFHPMEDCKINLLIEFPGIPDDEYD